jgi:hypothetical protein
MRMLNQLAFLVCCAYLATLTAACGGDDDGGAGTGAAGTSVAGSGSAGTGAAGASTAGTGAAGSGTAGTGAAGSGTAGTGAGTAGGEVSDVYSDYCVATFTEAYEVSDVFGDTELSIESGARYLLADFGNFSADVDILYLSSAGPIDFAISPDENGDYPFTSNCDSEGANESYIGVFTDVIVYEDEALTTTVCTLDEDTVEVSSGFAFELVSDIFAEPSVYRVEFGALATLCNGATSGYITANSATVAGTQHTVIPVASFIGPP